MSDRDSASQGPCPLLGLHVDDRTRARGWRFLRIVPTALQAKSRRPVSRICRQDSIESSRGLQPTSGFKVAQGRIETLAQINLVLIGKFSLNDYLEDLNWVLISMQ